MKKAFVLLYVIAIQFYGIAITKHDSIIDKRFDILTDTVNAITSRNTAFQIAKNATDTNNQILNARLEQSSNTIENLNVALTIFGLVIGLFAIGLPLVTYMFGIRPSRKAIKNLEQNIDKKIEAFLLKNETTRFNNAIENLRSTDDTIKYSGQKYFEGLSNLEPTNQQAFQIIDIIDNAKINIATRTKLTRILINNETQYSTAYFNRFIAVLDEEQYTVYAIEYFVKNGVEKNIDKFKTIVSNMPDFFNHVLTYIKHFRHNELIYLLNEKEIIDKLGAAELNHFKGNLPGLPTDLRLDKPTFESTYFYKKVRTHTIVNLR